MGDLAADEADPEQAGGVEVVGVAALAPQEPLAGHRRPLLAAPTLTRLTPCLSGRAAVIGGARRPR